MSFERACTLAEIADDEPVAAKIGEYAVAIARCGDEVFALQDLCSHQAVALSEGEVSSDGARCVVECWLHGSRFDLRTGEPTNLPATEPVSTFPVELRPGESGETDVYIDTTTTLNGVRPS